MMESNLFFLSSNIISDGECEAFEERKYLMFETDVSTVADNNELDGKKIITIRLSVQTEIFDGKDLVSKSGKSNSFSFNLGLDNESIPSVANILNSEFLNSFSKILKKD